MPTKFSFVIPSRECSASRIGHVACPYLWVEYNDDTGGQLQVCACLGNDGVSKEKVECKTIRHEACPFGQDEILVTVQQGVAP